MPCDALSLAIRSVREQGFYIYEHAAMPESLAIANVQRFAATAIAIAKRGPLSSGGSPPPAKTLANGSSRYTVDSGNL